MSIALSDPSLPQVRIRINLDKCQTPMACPTPCYRVCPQGVFIVAPNPVKANIKWYVADINRPGDYTLIAPMIPKCIGCMECSNKCPTGALKIKVKSQKEGDDKES